MKRIALFILVLTAASSTIAALGPREAARLADMTDSLRFDVTGSDSSHSYPLPSACGGPSGKFLP